MMDGPSPGWILISKTLGYFFVVVLGETDNVHDEVTLEVTGNQDDVTCFVATQALVFSKEIAEEKG